jgi:hypothetical protein
MALTNDKATIVFATLLFTFGSASQISCRAEKLTLDPFTPNVRIYKVALTPAVTAGADITTTRFAVHPVAQLNITYDVTKLTNDALAISKNALPIAFQGGPCQFTIQDLSNLNFSIVGNTGIITGTADVNAAGCPLSSGSVTVSARFVPVASSTKLNVKVFGIQVQVPWTWNVAGAIAGQPPGKLIQTKIEKMAADLTLTVPDIDNVKVAFQGASLNINSNVAMLTVQADALINKQAVASALAKWDAFQDFSIVFPKQ